MALIKQKNRFSNLVVIVKMVLKEAVVRPIVLVIQTLAQKDEWRFKKGDSEK